MKKKENLIIIPGFANNSLFLQEALLYLNNFFNVYCIDLPGFIENCHPIGQPDIDNFTIYVEKKLSELNLPDYYLAGISFGYAIISRLHLNTRCKGILAIYPYLNESYLKLNIAQKFLLKITLASINKRKLGILLWHSPLFKWYLRLTGHSPEDIAYIYAHIDATTYFAAADYILNNTQKINLQKLPHVVILNKQDEILDYYRLLKTFKDRAKKLILTSSLSHIPKELTFDMMKLHFPPALITRMQSFFSQAKRLT